MGFKCGIVGLPNVGKSTLFNALTNSNKAQAENFPFCTIDPNIGVVAVPDKRLDQLAIISDSKKNAGFFMAIYGPTNIGQISIKRIMTNHHVNLILLFENPIT